MLFFDELLYEDLDEDQQELADCIGFESYKKFIMTYGGSIINVHVPALVCIRTRNRKIRNEFDGRNYRQLAQKYELSESMVRRIINGSYKEI